MITINVSDLFKCPYFKPYPWIEELAEEGRKAHEQIEKEFKERHPNSESEIKVEKVYNINGIEVKLVGRIDLIDYEENIIYEIKRHQKHYKIPPAYKLQLYTYIILMRNQNPDIGAIDWVGRFIFYRVNKGRFSWYIYKPFFYNLVEEDVIVKAIKFHLEVKEKIENGLCNMCQYNKTCKPRYKFTEDGLVEEKN